MYKTEKRTGSRKTVAGRKGADKFWAVNVFYLKPLLNLPRYLAKWKSNASEFDGWTTY